MLGTTRRLIVLTRRQHVRFLTPCGTIFTSPLCVTPIHFATTTTNIRTYASPPELQKDKNQTTDNISEIIDLDSLPPIEVTGSVARCDGDIENNLGHPSEFIRVSYDQPERCKYCGLRYIRVHEKGHH